jgi:hypothetical protein
MVDVYRPVVDSEAHNLAEVDEMIQRSELSLPGVEQDLLLERIADMRTAWDAFTLLNYELGLENRDPLPIPTIHLLSEEQFLRLDEIAGDNSVARYSPSESAIYIRSATLGSDDFFEILCEEYMHYFTSTFAQYQTDKGEIVNTVRTGYTHASLPKNLHKKLKQVARKSPRQSYPNMTINGEVISKKHAMEDGRWRLKTVQNPKSLNRTELTTGALSEAAARAMQATKKNGDMNLRPLIDDEEFVGRYTSLFTGE